MKILKDAISFKFREKGSLFLAELHPASDAHARETILSAIRKRDHDATHHCTAWRTGIPVSAFGIDDDGEPSGTAGPPMLKVLEGYSLTDVLAICVRWFGGTKLGTGGLVRAYAQGIQGAIQEGERLGLFEQVQMLSNGTIEVTPELAHLPYGVVGAFKDAKIVGQNFGAGSTKIAISLPTEDKQAFDTAWRDRSRGGGVVWEDE